MFKLPFFVFFIFLHITSYPQDADPDFLNQLASHWAPIHYQSIRKTDGIFNKNSLGGKSDSLSNIDFDNDWVATNNWKNLSDHSITPTLYYYVATTSTHYYITYGYFHPRDWTRLNLFHFAQHENDLEGVMLVIEKNQTTFGKLILGYSIFHLSIKRYIYDPEISGIRHPKRFGIGSTEENHHPISYQQPRGHGIKLDDAFFKSNRPYCRYIPEEVKSTTLQDQTYQLINFTASGELFSRRNNSDFFNPDETIRGSHGEGANPPWLWTDFKDQKKHPHLRLFIDPANYVLMDYETEKPFDVNYTHHPFMEMQ